MCSWAFVLCKSDITLQECFHISSPAAFYTLMTQTGGERDSYHDTSLLDRMEKY